MNGNKNQIRSHLDRDPGRQAVVVRDVEKAATAVIVFLLLWRTDGVIGVDDRDDVELEELLERQKQLTTEILEIFRYFSLGFLLHFWGRPYMTSRCFDNF